MGVNYSKEGLIAKPPAAIKQIKANAQKAGRLDIVRLCDEVLADLSAIKLAGNKYVTEFHFVCREEENPYQEEDGRFSTGKWVVSEKYARVASHQGSVVALHREKGAPSYWQGKIEGWRPTISPDDKTQHRVEFICTTSAGALEWCGDGSGEKGYRWSDGGLSAELD